MLIHWKDIEGNIQVLDVLPSDESECVRGVMEPNTLTLHFSLPYYVNIAAGAYCVFEGERYELVRPQVFAKNGNRKWDYTLTMESAQGLLAKWKVRNPADGSLEFPYTATPKQHIDLLIEILNTHAEQGGVRWRTGVCVEAAEKLINYNHTQLSEALSELATLFETEFEITSEEELGVAYATIHFGRVEYNKDAPLSLSYGPNGGLLAGVKRENSDAMAVARLFVQGTEDNITSARYNPLGSAVGSRRLLLPISQELGYDGTYFSDESGFNEMVGRTFKTSADGQSITLANDEGTAGNEDSLDCTDIIPTKELTITMVEREEATNSEGERYYNYDIVLSIPQDEDYRDYTVEGEIAYVAFQSGMLAGREFDIHTLNNGVLDIDLAYNNDGFKGWRFKLVGDEMDGYFMPSDVWEPKVGDMVKIFGIQLPEGAICDNETRSGASWDMFREAIRVMWERSNTEVYYEGELSQVWVAKYWQNVGAKVRVGGYVRLTDEDFEREGALIRITGVRTYINNKYAPQLTLSNEVVHSGFKSTIAQIKGEEVKNEAAQREVLDFTKRRFRDAKESQAMLAEALIGEFTESLSPIAVNTMQAIVGSTALQYTFVTSLEDMTPQTYQPTIADEVIVLPDAFIKHETLGIDEVKPQYTLSDYLRWSVTGGTLAFEDSNKAYYLYIRASKPDTTAEMVLSPTAIGLEERSGYYHFLLATIGKLTNGVRSYQAWNGFTEITPAAIRANRFVSTDGQQYVDFEKKEFRVGNADKWVQYYNGELELSGAVIGESILGRELSAVDANGEVVAGLSGNENEPLIYGLAGSTLWYKWSSTTPNKYYYTTVDPALMAEGQEGVFIYSEPNYDSLLYTNGTVPTGGVGVLTVIEGTTLVVSLVATGDTVQSGPNNAKYRLTKSGTQIIGQPNGARIEIKPNEDTASMTLYDKGGDVALTISTKDYERIEDLSDILPEEYDFTNPQTITLQYSDVFYGKVNSVEVEAKTPSKLYIPEINVTYAFNTQGAGWDGFGIHSVECILNIKVDGTIVKTEQMDAIDFLSQTKQSQAFEINIPQGKHDVSVYLTLAYVGSRPNFSMDVITCQVSCWNDNVFELAPIINSTIVTGNCISVIRNSRKFQVFHTEDTMEVNIDCGNAGVKVNKDSLKLKIGGYWYDISVSNDSLKATR